MTERTAAPRSVSRSSPSASLPSPWLHLLVSSLGIACEGCSLQREKCAFSLRGSLFLKRKASSLSSHFVHGSNVMMCVVGCLVGETESIDV